MPSVPGTLHIPKLSSLCKSSTDGNYGFDGVDLTGLPNMHQLRYLAVYDGWEVQLPTQITGLRHLETLDVCNDVCDPFDIVHLPCLMFLNVDWRLAQTPYGIGLLRKMHSHQLDI
uniref:Disease resistance R13L4/SHOC-2-like LRR domain-containing protein n=1 Tax=Aegilops tauschii TaxID=37682 RepID=N1QYT5_AEGTA